MITANKNKVDKYLDKLPDSYVSELITYLKFLEFRSKSEYVDISSMLLSEPSLAEEWSTPEEDEAWQHL